MTGILWGLTGVAALVASSPALSQSQSHTEQAHPDIAAQEDHPHNEVDNGTDPTRVRRSLTLSFEHTDLRSDFTSDAFELDFSQPIGPHTSITTTLNLPSIDVAGDKGFGLGDTEIVLTHIATVNRHRGIVFKAGAIFDTASRPELGSGNTVLEGTFIYAWFLKGGHIFAPSFEYDVGIDRDRGREHVSTLTADFYFVPKLKDRRTYMTVDPFIGLDFEADKHFAGLSVTLGRVIGKAFGGNLQAYVKPSGFVGKDRGANWGFETGVKLIGF